MAACTTDSGGVVGIPHPTLVAVSPQDFLGSVPCADTPGAMRSYVATLVDVTEDLGTDAEPLREFALPSSPPVSCDQNVAFSFVAPGHRYAADIFGYDRDDLTPLASGSPLMLASDGQVVQPRWTTSCGRLRSLADGGADAGVSEEAGADAETPADAGTDAHDEAPLADADSPDGSGATGSATAIPRTTRYVRGCAPLEDRGSAGETAISVRLEAALGTLVCGDEAGQVSRFRAVLASTGEEREGACGDSLVFSALQGGVFHEIFVDAFEKDASVARFGTRCWRKTQAGVTLEASCDPLSEFGAVALHPAPVLAARNVACASAELVRLEAALELDPPRSIVRQPPDCALPIVFDALVPGEYRVKVTITRTSDPTTLEIPCTASVAAGRTTFASCASP